MKKINSKQTGNSIMSAPQTVAAGGLAVVWMVVVILASMVGLSTYVVILIMAITGGSIAMLFFHYVLNKANFENVVTEYQYRLRRKRNETSVYMFTLPLKQLKKHIPIEHVHDNGLIEYTKKRYGAVFKYDPPPVPMSEKKSFHNRIEYIVNSFGPGIEASFHFYDMIDHSNHLADVLLRAINTEGKTLQQKQHLHGMYEEATKSDEPNVDSSFLFSIKLGKFDSVELANIAYKSTVPGIIKAMRERGIYAIQLVGETEIIIEFRQFAVMEKYQ